MYLDLGAHPLLDVEVCALIACVMTAEHFISNDPHHRSIVEMEAGMLHLHNVTHTGNISHLKLVYFLFKGHCWCFQIRATLLQES